MKIPVSIQRAALPLALVGAVVPAILLGCGGGGSSSSTPTATSAPTAVTLPLTSFGLSNGQFVTLNLTRTGSALSGTAKISNTFPRVLAGGSNKITLPFQIPEGTYDVAGDFSAPSSFSVSGTAGTAGAFTLTGTLPLEAADGTYSLTIGGVTETGIIPRGGATPNTTPTPTPTTTAGPASSYNLRANLMISNGGGGLNFEPTDVDPTLNVFTDFSNSGFFTGTSTGRQFLKLNAARPSANPFGENLVFLLSLQSRSFSQPAAPFFVGQRISLAPSPESNGTNVNQLTLRLFDSAYVSTAGRVTVTRIGTNFSSVSLSFNNVVLQLQPDIIGGTPTPMSTLSAIPTQTAVPNSTPTIIVNGSLTATGLTTSFQTRTAGESR